MTKCYFKYLTYYIFDKFNTKLKAHINSIKFIRALNVKLFIKTKKNPIVLNSDDK